MRTKVNCSILGGDGTLSRASRAPGRLIRATSIGRCKCKLSGQVQVVQRIVGERARSLDSVDSLSWNIAAIIKSVRSIAVFAVPRLVGQVVALVVLQEPREVAIAA